MLWASSLLSILSFLSDPYKYLFTNYIKFRCKRIKADFVYFHTNTCSRSLSGSPRDPPPVFGPKKMPAKHTFDFSGIIFLCRPGSLSGSSSGSLMSAVGIIPADFSRDSSGRFSENLRRPAAFPPPDPPPGSSENSGRRPTFPGLRIPGPCFAGLTAVRHDYPASGMTNRGGGTYVRGPARVSLRPNFSQKSPPSPNPLPIPHNVAP